MYRHISEGNWENYDPFEIDYRLEASMTSTSKGFSFFKAFQGWLSFSSSGPNDGTLKVFPNLKEATAFWYSQPLNHTNGNGNKKDYFSSVIFSISIFDITLCGRRFGYIRINILIFYTFLAFVQG